ncbi:PIN-like domain-containing protein [Actinosynnema sp. NPDC091369]
MPVRENSHDPTQGFLAGFEGYLSPSDQDFRAVLMSGMVVLDTNVLLNLYRFDEDARMDLLTILDRLRNNVWIPHQALEEFLRNREQTILSRSNIRRDALESLKKPVRALEHAMENWARGVGLPQEKLTKYLEQISSLHDALREAIEGPTAHDPLTSARDTNHDPVLASLRSIFEGRVGEALPNEEFVAALAEAKRRADEKIPPGYMDRDKPDHRGPGDYLVWEQTLREAARRSTDVLLVTSDMKEDWWRKVRGTPAGPRVELVDELRRRAGVRLFMLQPQDFLTIAGRLLDVEVRPDSENQIASTAIGTSGLGSGDGDRVRLYLTSALESALGADTEVRPGTGLDESTWDVSVVLQGELAAVIWIYDPIKPFNDLATGSVITTARSRVLSVDSPANRPWLACVVDLANLATRMRTDGEVWSRKPDGDGTVMTKVYATFEPYIRDLRDAGFDDVQVIADLDQPEGQTAETFRRIDKVVEQIAHQLREWGGDSALSL